jgi:inhibitor of cysteine peptidase
MRRSITALTLALLLAIATVAATGCGSSGSTTSQPKPQIEEPAPVLIGQKDSGSTQLLSTGQQLIVTLEGNPTTGYAWSIDGTLTPQLKQSGEPTFTADSSAIGSGGKQVWTFIGLLKGQGQLKMKYTRSFEPTEQAANTFLTNVTVK